MAEAHTDAKGIGVNLDKDYIDGCVRNALREDSPWGDITTESLFHESDQGSAQLVMREDAVCCGLSFIEAMQRAFDDMQVYLYANDGDVVCSGACVASIEGSLWSLLRAERIMLNFFARGSGIATLTRQYTDAIAHTNARIVDTRKTTPCLRRFEKYAVACGGGIPHRFGLSDAVMVKDNHVAFLRAQQRDIKAALRKLRTSIPHTTSIEVEVDHLDQISLVLDSGVVDTIMFDNFSIDALREGVSRVDGRARTEASGGISLHTVRATAETGVDRISIGALTHAARWVDAGLDFTDSKLTL